MFLYTSLLVLLVTSAIQAAREEDRVTFLPGLEEQPTFNHYAGHLDGGNGRKLFYWFVESENDPATDPVVLWLNGGPGCSSLTGFLVELGPWRVNEDGSGLIWFEERWNKIANMIFLESPAGVGYSYQEDCVYDTSDDDTALQNYLALQDFFEGFPEYRQNDFYITGESYAGVYVPTLSALVVDDPTFNFKGMAIGNGVTDREISDTAFMYFAFARGLFGTDLRNRLIKNCCVDFNSSNCDFHNFINSRCTAAVIEASLLIWFDGVNVYNIYQTCDGGAVDSADKLYMALPEMGPQLYAQQKQKLIEARKTRAVNECEQIGADVPCTSAENRYVYLNNPEVREALHVPEHVHEWEFCSSMVSAVYQQQYTTVAAEYYKVLNAGHRILKFFGDLDAAVDHLGGLWFIESLGIPEVQSYQKWYYTEADGSTQVAGFSAMYDRLNYVTVKGAGHFVPTDMPIPAYEMWRRFIYDLPF